MSALEDFDWMSPRVLMTPEEFKAARKHQRELRLSYKKRMDFFNEKPKNYEIRLAKVNARIDSLNASQDLLCESVLKREIGLERYMVLRAVRYDGFSANLQALEFSLCSFGLDNRPAWHVDGRSIRKDGCLGAKSGCLTFDFARIERRRLDGTWARLTRRKFKDASESK